MPSQVVNLKIAGLQTNEQYLGEVPDGALLKCVNFNHDRRGILEKRRGFYIYGDSAGSLADRVYQLLTYKGRILRHYLDKIDSDNGSGTFVLNALNINAPFSDIRIKAQEVNGNLYFTSSTGIKKIDAKDASKLNLIEAKDAGGLKALHVEGQTSGTIGFLDAGYKVGYRITWAYNDNNNNLIIGSPSELLVVENNTINPVNIELTFPVPNTATTLHYYQIYRSQAVLVAGVVEDELNLVVEEYPSVTQFTNKNVTVTDITPDDFRDGGTALYTNAISGTGIISANEAPPLAGDITLFRNYTFYANTKTKHQMTLNLLSVDDLFDAITTISIYSNNTIRTYTFNTTENTSIGQIQRVTSGTVAYNVQETAKSLVRVINNDNSSVVSAFYESSIDDVPGQIFLERKDLTDATFNIVMNKGDVKEFNASLSKTIYIDSNIVGSPTTVTSKTYSFDSTTNVNIATDEITISSHGLYTGQEIKLAGILPTGLISGIYYVVVIDSNTIKLTSSEDEARKDTPTVIDITATVVGTGLLNPTHSLSSGNAIYITGSNSTPSINGERVVTVVDEISFTIPVNVTVAGSAGSFFSIESPVSNNDEKANRIYYSKLQQPEAVPAINYIDIGPQDKEIKRIIGLRDSLFIFKQDGIYRLSGESSNSFSVQQFDSSAIIIAPDSASILNNQIYVLTTQGIVLVSDTGVQIVSKPIDNIVNDALLNTNYNKYAFALSSEQDRAYYLFLPTKVTDTTATQCFRFSSDTSSWTSWDKKQTCGVLNPGDNKIYFGAVDANYIEKERKNLDRTDHADREYPLTLNLNGIDGTIITGFTNIDDIEDGDVVAQTQYLTLVQYNQLLRQLDLDSLSYNNIVSISTGTSTILEITNHQLNTYETVVIKNVTGSGSDNINDTHVVTVIDSNHISIPVNSTTYTLVGGKAKYSFNSNLIAISGNSLTLKLEKLSTKLQLFYSNNFTDTNSKTGFFGTGSQFCYDFNNAPTTFINQQIVFNLITDRLNESIDLSISNYIHSSGSLIFEELVITTDDFSKDVTIYTEPNFIAGAMSVFKAIKSIAQWVPSHGGDPSIQKRIMDGAIIVDNQGFSSLEVKYSTDLSPGFEGNEFLAESIGLYGQAGFGNEGFGGVSSSRPMRCLIPRNKSRCRFISPRVRHLNAREAVRIFGFNLTIEPTTNRNYRGSGILKRD